MPHVSQMASYKIADEKSLSQRLDIEHWERGIEGLDSITKITPQNWQYFTSLFVKQQDADSYLTSPAYYAFTGRNGLWIHQEGDSFVPFCWHPNTEGQILVFPTRGEPHISVLQNLLQQLPEPPQGVRLARIKKDAPSPHASENFVFAPIVENVLDWKYPVRVLSTERAAKMEGPDFRYIRNHVKHAKSSGAGVLDLNDASKAMLNDFIDRWAESHSANAKDREGIAVLYHKILSFADDPATKVRGFVVTMDNRIEALSMWDVSNCDEPTGNRFVNLCNRDIRGIADFATQCLAQQLYDQGIGFLNIGGAETESLDQFKSKFMPVRNIEMYSVSVVYVNPMTAQLYPNYPESASTASRSDRSRPGLLPG
ncbi:MAG: phosphatidylglycerol lysyltransferase domain-containing protein [Negativicutes bacterium]|nr:phosphatidylglycerol lysyltransferase domain-containing protein [Negativicutes bacterium]